MKFNLAFVEMDTIPKIELIFKKYLTILKRELPSNIITITAPFVSPPPHENVFF